MIHETEYILSIIVDINDRTGSTVAQDRVDIVISTQPETAGQIYYYLKSQYSIEQQQPHLINTLSKIPTNIAS